MISTLRLANVESLSVNPSRPNKLDVTLGGVTEQDILPFVNIEVALSWYGADRLLEKIGKEQVIKLLNIEEK